MAKEEDDCALMVAADQESYNNAITLNDIGVSLLAQGAIQQSMETLHDAVSALKMAFRPEDESLNEGSVEDAETKKNTKKIQTMVSKAVTRLSSPETTTQASRAEAISIQVVSYEDVAKFPFLDEPIPSLESTSWAPYACSLATRTCPTSSKSTAESRSLDASHHRDFDLDSAIMLYNFGLSYLCLDMVKDSTKRRLESAQRLFQMSYSIISKLLLDRCSQGEDGGYEETEEQEEHEDIECYVLMVTFVMRNLAHTLLLQGKLIEAQVILQRLTEFNEIHLLFEGDDNIFSLVFLPAPAA